MKSVLYACFFVMFLNGCKSTGNLYSKSYLKQMTNSISESEGILFGSLGTDIGSYITTPLAISIRNTDTEEAFSIVVKQADVGFASVNVIPVDFENKQSRGYVFAVKIPEGNYEMYSTTLRWGYSILTPEKEFSVPFNVKKGSVNYLGRFALDMNKGKNLFGTSVLTGGQWYLYNKFDEELKLLLKKESTLSNFPIINSYPENYKNTSPYVILK